MSKAIRKFSGNSSISEMTGFPYVEVFNSEHCQSARTLRVAEEKTPPEDEGFCASVQAIFLSCELSFNTAIMVNINCRAEV